MVATRTLTDALALSTATQAKTEAQTARDLAVGAAASVAFLYDVNSVRYAYGKLVLAAAADPAGVAGWAVTQDGYFYAKFAIKPGPNLNVYRDVDGFTSIGLGTVAGEVPLGTAAKVETTTNVFAYGKDVLWGVGAANGGLGVALTSDGYLMGKYAVRLDVANGLTLTRGSDGFLSLKFGQTEGLQPRGTAGAVTDTTSSLYVAGRLVMWGVAGADGRAALALTDDGLLRAKIAAAPAVAANGLTVAYDSDGVLRVGLGAVEGEIPIGTAGKIETTSERYYDGKRVTWARVDASGRASIVETEDGAVYIIKARGVTNGGPAVETADFLFSAEEVNGGFQVYRTSKATGTRQAITSLGNNNQPTKSADGSKLIYFSDRNGKAREAFYQPVAGGAEHPVVPFRTIQALGDSLTAAGYADDVAAALGVTLVAPSSSPESGIGSQDSTQAVARYGAIPLTCSLAGNTMNAGANELTAISVQLLSRTADAVGTLRTLRASILGVKGDLKALHNATAVAGALQYTATDFYSYTFTPDAGQTLPAVPAGTSLVIETGIRQDCTLLLAVGRNNVGRANWQTTVKADIASALAAYKPLVRRIVIIGIPNSTGEPSGSANYNAIVAFNAELAALYPDHFVDIRPAYNAGTADDTPAPALTADGLHYNTAGKAVWKNTVLTFINSKGWN